MLPNNERFVSMLEVELAIRAFEQKYGIMTAAFLRNAKLRSELPEDDVFQWEAFEAHREELVRIGEELRSEYLASLERREPVCQIPATEKQYLLAA